MSSSRNTQWDAFGLSTEQRIAALAEDVDAHHAHDDSRFAALHLRFDRLEDKMDDRLGRLSARTTGAVIGIMSGIIVALVVALVTVR